MGTDLRFVRDIFGLVLPGGGFGIYIHPWARRYLLANDDEERRLQHITLVITIFVTILEHGRAVGLSLLIRLYVMHMAFGAMAMAMEAFLGPVS
jgi:hypothetical protein